MAMFNSYVKLPEGSSTIQISSFKLPSKLPAGTVHKKNIIVIHMENRD